MSWEAGLLGSNLTLLLMSCVTLGKLLNFSEPQSHLGMIIVPTSHEAVLKIK